MSRHRREFGSPDRNFALFELLDDLVSVYAGYCRIEVNEDRDVWAQLWSGRNLNFNSGNVPEASLERRSLGLFHLKPLLVVQGEPAAHCCGYTDHFATVGLVGSAVWSCKTLDAGHFKSDEVLHEC